MSENQEQIPSPTIMNYLFRVMSVVGVLAIGLFIFGYFVSTRPEPKKVERTNLGELVEVIDVRPDKQNVRVPANGQVVPAQQVALSAEVGGRVVWVNERLIPGGRFAAGDKLVRIDPREYSLALEQQAAQVDRAKTELQLEKSRKEIAEREWQLMGGSEPAEGSLAVRDPQLRTAEAAFKAAKSGMSRAQLSVSKTTISAPFNAMVHSKSVDLGQLVGPQAPVATLVGTDAFWVQVSIPLERLAWIQVPGVDSAAEGADAVISQMLGNKTIRRKGKVIRLLPDLDPMGRMARILVEIPDPLGLKAKAGKGPGKAGDNHAGEGAAQVVEEEQDLPLLIGSYVNVEIEGREVDRVIELPREALRGGNEVYVITDKNTLDIRTVGVIWRRPDSVLIGEGLQAGDRVVVSPLPAAVKGMKLRVAGADGAKAATSKPPAGEPSGNAGAVEHPGDKPGSKSSAADKPGAKSGGAPSASKVSNPSR